MNVALTGSIGMGKSTVAAMAVAAGIPLFDADAEVRRLQGPGGALVGAIEAAFPGTTTDGAVDRDALSARVLGDPDALARLEAIVHPAVLEARLAFLDDTHDAPIRLFDIPLLFETGGEGAFDAVIVVSAPADVQRARVLARPNMTPQKFDQILARQLPDAEKRARATHVIDTGGSLDETRAQLDRILACLRRAAGG